MSAKLLVGRRLSRATGVQVSISTPEASYDSSLAGLEWVSSIFEKERRIPVVRAVSSNANAQFTALVCGPWNGDMGYVSKECELLRQVVPMHTVHFDYAGFGLARSTPLTERRCVDDAVSVYRWLLETHNILPQRLLLIGVEVGACVALELAYLATKSPNELRKLLGFTLPSPLCAAMVLQAPAIAPALSLAAALLRSSAPTEPFAAQRKHLVYINVPALVAVGKKSRTNASSNTANSANNSAAPLNSSNGSSSSTSSASSSAVTLTSSNPGPLNTSNPSSHHHHQHHHHHHHTSASSLVSVDHAHVVAAAKQLKFLWRLLEIDDVDSDLYDDDDYLGAVRALVGVMLGTVDESDRALVAALSNRPTQFQSPEEVISTWLKEIGLQEHATRFVANGYDSLPIIRTMSIEELASIGITDEVQQALLMSSLADDINSNASNNSSNTSEREQQPDAPDARFLSAGGGLVRASSTSKVNSSSMPASLGGGGGGGGSDLPERKKSGGGGSAKRTARELSADGTTLGAAPGIVSRMASTAWSVIRVHDGVAIETALWLDTPTCACCSAQFTLLRRRHHCRACGACVCFACSRGTLSLSSPASLPPSTVSAVVSPRARHSTPVEHVSDDEDASSSNNTSSTRAVVSSTNSYDDENSTPLTSPRGTSSPSGAPVARAKVLVRTRKRRTSATIAPAISAPTSPQSTMRSRGKTSASTSSLHQHMMPGGEQRSRACDRCCDARAKILQLPAHEQALLRGLSLNTSGPHATLESGLPALFVEERGARYPCTLSSCADGAVFLIEVADITRTDTRRIYLLARDVRTVRRGAALFPSNSMPDASKTAHCFTIVCDLGFYHFQPGTQAEAWVSALEAVSKCMQAQSVPMPPDNEPPLSSPSETPSVSDDEAADEEESQDEDDQDDQDVAVTITRRGDEQ